MAEQIIIEGSVVRHVRTETLAESAFTGLAPFLTTRLATTLPVLPQHPVRFVSFDPESGRGLMIVETKPGRHILQVRHSGQRYDVDAQREDADGLSRWNVQLPYQYFAYPYTMVTGTDERLRDFTIGSAYLFWAKDAIRTENDLVHPARCPNVDTSGSICWGSTNSDSASLSARIDDLVNNFYLTIFNEDLGHLTPFGDSLTDWETASADPLAWRQWDYWNNVAGIPISGVAEYIHAAPSTNMAELNPSFVDIPELPQNFTVAHAQDWLSNLDPGALRRIMAAVTLHATQTGERENADETTAEAPA